VSGINLKHLHYFWAVARAGGVVRAAEQLHITPQTVSAQIALLEEHFGQTLFARRGRELELTPAGQVALRYAQEIFALGSELQAAMRQRDGPARAVEFRVGVANAVPKSIAFRLLEPALHMPEPVRLVCRESKLTSLLSELAVHRLEMVLADVPVPQGLSVKAFNHRLGVSGVSFLAAPELVRRCKGSFPQRMRGMPMLLPGSDAAIRSRLDDWFARHALQPHVVGEFDDGALMKAFGQQGVGIFIAPSVLEAEIEAQYGVRALGRTAEVVEEFYAISVERRIRHPCVSAITDAARDALFAVAMRS
jgi:LysR family transcriptional activator of nhaA